MNLIADSRYACAPAIRTQQPTAPRTIVRKSIHLMLANALKDRTLEPWIEQRHIEQAEVARQYRWTMPLGGLEVGYCVARDLEVMIAKAKFQATDDAPAF